MEHNLEEINKNLLKEIENLYIQDGWSLCTTEYVKENETELVLVLNDSGIHGVTLRYLEWDSDYDEWRGKKLVYPVFYKNIEKTLDDLDLNIDNTPIFLICKSFPSITENTRKAEKLLEEYWNNIDKIDE